MGRGVDLFGGAVWGNALRQGISRDQVAADILNSHEAHEVTVEQLFNQYLHRPVDPFGLQSFSTALDQGIGETLVLAAIVGSQEYANRV